MKTSAWLLTVTLLALTTALVADNRHQVGSTASGRASSANLRLESVIGQTAIGFSGENTSGFLSSAARLYYLPGDADQSGLVNISDVTFLISYIFGGGPGPHPLSSGDANCDGMINVSDVVSLIAYIFSDGIAPHYCP